VVKTGSISFTGPQNNSGLGGKRFSINTTLVGSTAVLDLSAAANNYGTGTLELMQVGKGGVQIFPWSPDINPNNGSNSNQNEGTSSEGGTELKQKLSSTFTVTNVMGSKVYYAGMIFDDVAIASGGWGPGMMYTPTTTNPIFPRCTGKDGGTITITVPAGDTNWHYVTVFHPIKNNNPLQKYSDTLTVGINSASYDNSATGVYGAAIYQFKFKGNATLVVSNHGNSGAGIIKAIFFD
jgi:hypothetical protein